MLIGIYNSTPLSASGPNSFGIVDVGDPEDLQEASTLLLEDSIQDAAVSGTRAYLLGEDGGSGASIIDFSDPTSPTQPGTIPFPSTGSWSQHSIAASGSLVSIAGITADGPRVHVFDAASPASPILKSALTPSGGSSISLWMSGMALFISSDDNDNNNFIEVYDLTDPAKPRPAGSMEAEGRAMNVTVLAGGDDDPIILLAKPGGSVHTYNYSVQTETITEGPICPSPNSQQVTVSQTPNSTGSYTVVTTDASYGTYIQEITREPKICCLTTSVSPVQAAADGCTALPVRKDGLDCGTSEGVTATPADPWVFKEWTGAATGTNPSAQALVTGSCSHATAHFWAPILTLGPGQQNPHDGAEFYGIAGQFDYDDGAVDVPIIHITLAANEVDDWRVTGLTFTSSGAGNEMEDLKIARLWLGQIGGTKIGEKVYTADNGLITFSPNVLIPKGESRSFILTYDFKPERAWPCNSYGAQIDMRAVAALPVLYPPGIKLPPADPVVGGPSRVKRGDLVKQEGSDNQYGQADEPESENNPLEEPLKVRLAWQHPASVNFVSYEIISPAAHGGFLDGAPGTRLVEKPVDAEGYTEAELTLGTRKGAQNPYDVVLDMNVTGAACISSWARPLFRAWGMGLDLATESQYDNPENAELFGTFLSNIQADNRFTLTIDMAPEDFAEVIEVLFNLGGQIETGEEVTKNKVYYADFDMSEFQSPQKLMVTVVMEKDGSIVEQTAEYDVKVLKLPGWVSVVEAMAHPESFSTEFSGDDGGAYNFSFTYPTNFMWSDTIPGDVGFLGGLGNDLDIEFTAEAAYRVDETSVFGAVVQGEPTILGYEFGLEGGLSGEFDPNFSFQRGNGMVRAEFGFDLPSKGYSKTFLIYGVPITAAVDLSGNVDIFIRGGAVLNRQVEFEEVTIAPGTTVTGHITVSLSAVFGLAKIAATGSPTATVEIEIRYTTGDGTTTTWRGDVAVPITVVGSIFWGIGSAELYSTTLGPWMFGDGVRAPLAFRPLGDLPTLPAPRLLTTSALAVGGEGRRMSVWIEDTEPDKPFPNPDVFFRFFDGASWIEPSPVIGIESPNDEWEMDPAAVFMAANNALSCWTANRGDKELSNLNAILAAQEIACAVWDGSAWGDPVYLTDDDRADGLVNLAYGGGNAFAVWVHSADGEDVLDRTVWELRYAVYDEDMGQWEPPAPVPGTGTGFSDQMPSVAANGASGVVLIWARDDDGVFYTENESGANRNRSPTTTPFRGSRWLRWRR